MTRSLAVFTLALLLLVPLAAALPQTTENTPSRFVPMADPPLPVTLEIDSIRALVEVPPGGTRTLRVDADNATLVPMDWVDPVEVLTGVQERAVDRVEPWLKRDLAIQLGRLGGFADKFARAIVDCTEDRYVDELAFTIAHSPPEVIQRVGNVNVLVDNAKQLYEQDQLLPYADIVERSAEDGNYTTVSYLNRTGVRLEYPRDIYYWYLAHARVFWEDPATVAGKSFWRKAYFEDISYNDSGTLKSWLVDCTNLYEAANASTVWMQMNMEFGYGTNPLQPVQVILERYGSCGQYSITTAASLKAAMIPARVAIYTASDHQWVEVWIDGHWMHVDASNDVAGKANVKEPELIRRTNSVNFNDAGVFERGWKPYMSATNAWRVDDRIFNSIDISAPDPAISMKESGMVERWLGGDHRYTNTSTVRIDVTDSGGDPIEGAWVGIFRIGHDVYNPGTPDYPHFAYANYTDADGWCEFELGLQGFCSRCDKDHTYAALILSDHYQGTSDFYEVPVKQEDRV
jgi:transglutaminase-like putative cysteine protease